MTSLALFQIICTIMSLQITSILSHEFSKSAKLTPNTSSSIPDIAVSLGRDTSVIGNLWSIDVISQQGTDLNIQLGPSWGFHSNLPSRIELYIKGNTSNETLHNDGEILFIFTTSDQYFAEVITIDKPKFAYKECPISNTPLIKRNISQMIKGPLPDRYPRFCNNSVHTTEHQGTDYWSNTGGSAYRETAQWPIAIEIKNNPILHTIDYKYGDSAPPTGPKLASHYTSSFPANQGLNIHISGESAGEDFNILSIDITYSYQGTVAPSRAPFPSIHPTASPTYIPTLAPITSASSIHPSMSPSTQPSVPPSTPSPSIQPSTQPSIQPSIQPSLYPTTALPTRHNATISPSLYPSITPTLYPSHMPSASTRTEAPLEVTLPPTQTPSTMATYTPTAMNNTIIMLHGGGKAVTWSERLLFIIGALSLALVCVCVLVLFMALMKHREGNAKSAVRVKEYDGVDAVDTMSPPNELYSGYGDDADKNGRPMIVNKSVDDSRNISSPVTGATGDDESDNAVVSDMLVRRDRGLTFNNNLENVVIGNDMMMDDVIKEMETRGQGGDFQSESDELLDTMHDEDYYKSGYEIGMVHTSKMSEKRASRSLINDSVVVEGNQPDELYEAEDGMETAGFIDGDYNALEYDDEYYEEQDD